MKKLLIFLPMILILISLAYAIPASWYGYVTLDGSTAADDVIVDAYISGSIAASTTVGAVQSNGYYLIHVEGSSGDEVSFKIYGNAVSEFSQSWIAGFNHPAFNLTANSTADGSACPTYTGYTSGDAVANLGCDGGYCVHSICRNASSYCGDGYIDGTEECDGSALDSETCVTQGYDTGDLACSASCEFDISDCSSSTSSCFPAGTKVLMADESYKNIEDILVGDYVMSYDEENNINAFGEVLELENPVRNHLCEIIFEDGSDIKLTNEHPVYTSDGWKSIAPEKTKKENSLLSVNKLTEDDKVLFIDSTYREINNINCWNEIIQTYNLKSIKYYNNFYAEDYLVHNKGGGGGGGSITMPITCTESWTCSGWSACVYPGLQTRICTDANTCGTTANKPVEQQSCFYEASVEQPTAEIIEVVDVSQQLIPTPPSGRGTEIGQIINSGGVNWKWSGTTWVQEGTPAYNQIQQPAQRQPAPIQEIAEEEPISFEIQFALIIMMGAVALLIFIGMKTGRLGSFGRRKRKQKIKW